MQGVARVWLRCVGNAEITWEVRCGCNEYKGTQRNTKEEQTAADLLALTRLLVINYTI